MSATRRAYGPSLVAMGRPLCTHISSPVLFRLDAHPVVNGVAEFLLASEVTLGSLDGDVPKQELGPALSNIINAAPRVSSNQTLQRGPGRDA